MTVGEMKRQVKALQTWADDLTRRTTLVHLLVEDRKLVDNSQTLMEVGVLGDAEIRVLFNERFVECITAEEAPCPLHNDCDDDNDDSLFSLKIPDGAAAIPTGAFSGSTSVGRLIIPNSVTEIGEFAFQNCSSVSSVKLPDFLTKVGGFCFQGCSSMESLTLPTSLTEIPNFCFEGCNALTSLSDTDRERCLPVLQILRGLDHPRVCNQDWAACLCILRVVSLSLCESLHEIGELAFEHTGLRSLTLPEALFLGDFKA